MLIQDTEWFEFNGDQVQEAAILYQMNMHTLTTQGGAQILTRSAFASQRWEDGRDQLVELFIQPIINYLNDKLDEGNSTLYLLEKYKRRIEWFIHDDLLKRFNEYEGKKEDVLDENLRLFLFDQGIDFPFSRPRSASGDADIVGLIDTKNPLILEVKYYNGKDYKKDRIIGGFAQIVRYANDYNKNIGYLVVFNVSENDIVIESEDNNEQFPSRVHFNNKDYFIIIVNLNFEKSASQVRKLKTETVTKEELTQPVEQL